MEEVKESTQEKKDEYKPTRAQKRVDKRASELLNNLVTQFFVERSKLDDLTGDYAAKLFEGYRYQWIKAVHAVARDKKIGVKLRPEAFNEQVDYYLRMEEEQKRKKAEEIKVKDFKHWFRKEAGWNKMFFRSLGYWIKCFGNKEKIEHAWKYYFVTVVLA
jgi:hypothetical protein